MDHALGCDGSCRNCPVPVEVRDPCDMCGGCGQVQMVAIGDVVVGKAKQNGEP